MLSALVLPALLFGALSHTGASVAADPALEVELYPNASFAVKLGGETWLSSGPLRAFLEGQWRSAEAPGASLKHTNTRSYDGSDELGHFHCTNLSWAAEVGGGRTIVLHTSVKSYEDQHTAVFIQELPQGATGTNASNPVLPGGTDVDMGAYPPVVAFPAFAAKGKVSELGFLTWQDVFAKVSTGVNAPAHLKGLTSNGPVALFDGDFRTLVVSPMDNFKSAVHTRSNSSSPAWETGVSSEIESLPAGFVHRTLLTTKTGLTAGLAAWGERLRGAYGTQRHMAEEDLNLNYLSYWTDNGGYYYGDVWKEAGGGGGVVNEKAMLAVADGLEQQGLKSAVKIWQLDDWWYKGHYALWVYCVEDWTLVPPAFSDNLGDLSKKLGIPWLLYVPFFCPKNVYQDKFRFVHGARGSTEFLHPHPDNALEFYRMLFDYGKSNGMRGYENDFLNFALLAVPLFRKQYGTSERWLQAMNAAALERDLPVQMCMALPSDLMETVRLNSVTNFRASDDYVSAINFDIGGTSLLALGLGLRPSKDNFWTHRPASQQATGKPWKPTENPGSNCELNTLIATLSTGPLGISDKAGNTNATLLRPSIRPDGLIIQPDRPATAIDATFMQPSLGSKRAALHGKVWSTHAAVAGVDEAQRPPTISKGSKQPHVWHYALSMNVSTPWQLASSDFYPTMDVSSGWVARRWHKGHRSRPCSAGASAVASGCISTSAIRTEGQMPWLHNDRPIMVENDTLTFDLMQFAPISAGGWVLLGDTSRYVGVSSKRFWSVNFTDTGLVAVVAGSEGETVEVTALRPVGDWAAAGGSAPHAPQEWTVMVERLTFPSTGPLTVVFGKKEQHMEEQLLV